ncbi:glycosyltransferase [Roseivivax sediminis]|uniref:Glycosyltransferase, catalytic subunit of cellulose synthase and poly-beta-1,6-N-acetylglucosamine synthase n=1 Tax=Roseivivax sediminis TaxID=936889 RepID=A0A1I1YPV1_9RHOB|nr:glycosyltransferase family 2 protein [Roseivivax sediminis]SFE21561.1 Glycosyltransferase, catalytic subunit of cellulose synthase and poly-beta-1,6-N-acetylglucosamine synthase [Roseivivax sediminis]
MSDATDDPGALFALPHARDRGRPMGGLMIDRCGMAAAELLDALGEAQATGLPLDRVLTAQGLAEPEEALRMLGRHFGLPTVDVATTPPDPELDGLLPPDLCLAWRVLPWRAAGDTLIVAATDPATIEALRPILADSWPQIMPALALEAEIETEIARRHGLRFAEAAAQDVPDDVSCRDLNLAQPGARRAALAAGILCLTGLALAPGMFFLCVAAVAMLSMLACQGLKLAAALAAPRAPAPPTTPAQAPRPVVTLLVPLFRESEIAGTLVERLKRLSYPKSALDVVLILEEADDATRRALSRADLPPWIRVIQVPQGPVTTKPRALNYARRFARGEIIGVLDAEDAPAANQVDRVVARFAAAGEDVACLQGVLDFYNPHANWLSRMFAIEYATWFRLVLPGLARLGLVIPLGGTTVYLRRSALQAVSGWDAHNVTEDADLGVRLARHGYRTELIATVTLEEANNRLWPWVRQRSRWIKGYMMTWAAHTRRPGALLRDLGAWRMAGMQILFLGTILQALLAPVLWTFWAVIFGLPHPAFDHLNDAQARGLVTLFLTSEAVTLAVGLAALARSRHTGLKRWVPTTLFYFPLSVAAAYKALWEVLRAPFYWDKTMHGASLPDHATADRTAE